MLVKFAQGLVFGAGVLGASAAYGQAQIKTVALCKAGSPGEHDVTHLPPVVKLPEGVTWMTDWAAQPETGGWYEVQAVDACRFHRDGEIKTWHGKAAARVEVGPGDDPLDLKSRTERAEGLISQTTNGKMILEDAKSGTQFYATSYLFPSDWGGTQYPWSAFAPKDCHEEDSNACNSWSIVMQFHLRGSHPWGFLYAARMQPNQPQRYALLFGAKPQAFSDDGLIALGKWTDFVFKIQWDANLMTVWRRDEGKKDFAVVVDNAPFTPPGAPVYLKQGLYRGGAVDGRTDVFWIGPTVRASSMEAATKAAFGDGE